ncbi:MAG TPA: aminotransferase class IV [Polyangiaceae bacterium]
MKIWMDGRVVGPEHATISVLDHGLLYGDGVFEGMRVIGGRLVDLEHHFARLELSARAIYLALPASRSQLVELVGATVAAHGQPEAYVRLVVTRGVGRLGIDTASCQSPKIVCMADSIDLYGPAARQGVRLVTASRRRPDPDVLDPRVKSLNYLNNVLNKHEAKRRGGDEALVLNRRGQVAEASAANVFVRQGRQLLTPPGTDGALEGITRRRLFLIAPELGLEVIERSLTSVDLLAADEVFLTGSGAGIVPVVALDDVPITAQDESVLPQLQRETRRYAERCGTPCLVPAPPPPPPPGPI